jgi:hypothetical protein
MADTIFECEKPRLSVGLEVFTGGMMEIQALQEIDQIKKGDLLLISDGREITHAKAQEVKVSEHDGVEVIFNLRRNKFFNVGMYLDGKSWAKDVRIVRMTSSAKVSGGDRCSIYSGVKNDIAASRA